MKSKYSKYTVAPRSRFATLLGLIIISSKFFLVDLLDLMHTKNLHPRCVTKFLWYLSNGLEVITSYTQFF